MNYKITKTLKGDNCPLTAFCFAKDGLHFVTGYADGKVKLWSAKFYKTIRTINGHTNAILSLDYTPDEKYLISSNKDNTIKFYRISDGKLMKRIDNIREEISCVVLPGSKKKYAALGCSDGEILFLRLPTAESTMEIFAGNSPITTMAFTEDERYMATGDEYGTVRLWKNPLLLRRYRKCYEAGIRALQAGKYDIAVVNFAEAASIFPEDEAKEKLKEAREKKRQAQKEQLEKIRKLQRKQRR